MTVHLRAVRPGGDVQSMEIRVSGAHNLESRTTRLPCLIVDGRLAFDAGGLTSGLTLEEQHLIEAIFLTHRHYDHVRDIPNLCMATLHNGKTVDLYGLEDTLETVRSHLLDGAMYPDFTQRPSPTQPKLRLAPLTPGHTIRLLDYEITPVTMRHGVPSVGFHIAAWDGVSLLYTGDTSGGLEEVVGLPRLDLLITEVTLPNSREDEAQEHGHLTPDALGREIAAFKQAGGEVPPVLVVHVNPSHEEEIRAQLRGVAAALGTPISTAMEGLTVNI